jgi:hypothetical protein
MEGSSGSSAWVVALTCAQQRVNVSEPKGKLDGHQESQKYFFPQGTSNPSLQSRAAIG